MITVVTGDCRAVLPTLPERSVQCVVASPPYFGLRNYGHPDQIGLEQTVEAYVAELVGVFRLVRRVLADDGVVWLNLGDSYATAGGNGDQGKAGQRADRTFTASRLPARGVVDGLKPKDLIGVPWRVAFALQADGWWLRSEVIWHKPNPMPESVRDRPTKAHEQVFLLAKGERYFYDAAAVAEAVVKGSSGSLFTAGKTAGHQLCRSGQGERRESTARNRRTVWTIPPSPFKGSHFAVMPPALVEPCVLAGSRPGDTVLDPFAGAGTTMLVADRLGRHGLGIELNPEYADLARQRVRDDAPLLAEVRT